MEQNYTTDKTDIFGIGITTKGRIERCVLYNVLLIPVHNAVCVQSLVNVVLQFHIFGVGQIFHAESLFRLFDTSFGKRCGLCLFVNDIVGINVNVKSFVVVLC